MNHELCKYLEIGEDGNLYSILEWGDEYHRDIVVGVNQILDIIFFEIQINNCNY